MQLARRIGALPERVQDGAIAAAYCALDLLAFSGVRGGAASVILDGVVLAYAALGFLVLVWRRRWPMAVFAATWIHSMVAVAVLLLAAVPTPSYRPFFGLMVALYTTASLAGLRWGLGTLTFALVPSGFAVAAGVQAAAPGEGTGTLIIAATLQLFATVGVWGLGRWVRAYRRQVRVLDQRREEAAREAAAAERSRVARELHDIITHSVNAMQLQAAGARRVLATDPDQAAVALARIEDAGSRATGELRRLLDLLRAGETLGEGEGQRRAQPGLSDLEPLLQRMRVAGVPVRLLVHGYPGRLDTSVDLSAYRIVQESLTNVQKYAGRGADTVVELQWINGAVHLAVTDDGDGQVDREPGRQVSTGHGLVGLRERAAAVGGQLEAGPLPGGGFRVAATLPATADGGTSRSGSTRPAGDVSGPGYRGLGAGHVEDTSQQGRRYSW